MICLVIKNNMQYYFGGIIMKKKSLTMRKQTLITGTFVLGFAGIFARFLGLFFRIPLQQLIGDEGLGYYSMSYPLYMVFVAFASGIPIGLSKIISEMNAKNDTGGIRYVLRTCLFIMVPVAGVFSVILLLFSRNIITVFKWDMKAYYAFIAVAIAPIFVVIMGAFRGFFQGLKIMQPTAISQIVEQIGRVGFGVGLAYILYPKGIDHAAGGAALGAVAGGVLGTIYLLYTYLKVKDEFPIGSYVKRRSLMAQISKTSLPISMGAAVGTIMGLIDSVLVPRQLLKAGFNSKEAAILFGQLSGKAGTLINVPLALSVALCSSIVPIVAEAYITNSKNEVDRRVKTALKLSSVIALPCAFGLFFLAPNILDLVYIGSSSGYNILRYLAISIPFIVLCQSSVALLQGMGKYYLPVVNLTIGCVIKIILSYTLVSIPYINVYGAIIGSVVGYVVASVLNMRLLRKRMNISINYYDIIIKPLFASVLMIIAVVFINSYVYNITMRYRLACILSIFLGVIIYFILVLIFKVFDYNEIKGRISKRFKK